MTNELSGTNEGKLWGGRFEGGPSPELEALSRSTHFDWRLALYDLAGSHAHAKALAAAGLLSGDEELELHRGLDALAERYTARQLWAADSDEDVHGALERLLRQKGIEASLQLSEQSASLASQGPALLASQSEEVLKDRAKKMKETQAITLAKLGELAASGALVQTPQHA